MKTLSTEAQAEWREPAKDVETPRDQSQQEATTSLRSLVIQGNGSRSRKEGRLLGAGAIKGTRNSRDGQGLKASLPHLSPSLPPAPLVLLLPKPSKGQRARDSRRWQCP